jgi:ATP-binding cassette subfamily G (WHITE) protein 2 (SNQ2)
VSITVYFGTRSNYRAVLAVLTQRQKTGVLSGDIMVGGVPISRSYVKDIGFCPQGDIHDETSTVYEAFMFSALLRQDPKVSVEEKNNCVEEILHTLGLSEFRNALISSLSLNLKRKTSIGVELCARPKLLLFLDEPTSVRSTL